MLADGERCGPASLIGDGDTTLTSDDDDDEDDDDEEGAPTAGAAGSALCAEADG